MNEIQTTGSSSNGLVPQYEVINEEWNKRMEETLNEEEHKLLQELRQRLKDDYCEEVKATATLIRFLRARKWDLDKSEQMYRHRNEWVKSYKPQLITHDMCLREFASGQAYWAGHDKHGRPTLMLRASKNDPSSYTQDDLFKCIIYMMEVGYRRLPNPPYNQYIVMYDLQGVSKKNLDFNSLKKFSSLGDYYPELLGCVYLLRPHWMLTLLFGVIRAIMDPVTQSKVRIIKEENLGQLLEDYDVDQLEKDLGGDPKYEVYPLYEQIRAQLSQQQNQ